MILRWIDIREGNSCDCIIETLIIDKQWWDESFWCPLGNYSLAELREGSGGTVMKEEGSTDVVPHRSEWSERTKHQQAACPGYTNLDAES